MQPQHPSCCPVLLHKGIPLSALKSCIPSLVLIPGVQTQADRLMSAWPFRLDRLDYWTDFPPVHNKACFKPLSVPSSGSAPVCSPHISSFVRRPLIAEDYPPRAPVFYHLSFSFVYSCWYLVYRCGGLSLSFFLFKSNIKTWKWPSTDAPLSFTIEQSKIFLSCCFQELSERLSNFLENLELMCQKLQPFHKILSAELIL